MKEPRVRAARHVVRWFLKATGYGGICLPPRGIYVLRERMTDGALLAHEITHWRQAQRMGVVKFYATYLWYTIRFGYRRNPLETGH